jgi:prepilin peptidase CpaA
MAVNWFLPGALAVTTLAVIWDLAERRIPNAITVAAMLGGLVGHALTGGIGGVGWSAGGLVVGLALLLVPALMGGMGGGDLKLMGALGALVGARQVFDIALLSGVAGGVLALAEALRRGVLKTALGRAAALCLPWRTGSKAGTSATGSGTVGELGSIPYGVAIGVGTWICVLRGGLDLW